MLHFDWDESKNRANRKKHGVWFEEARSAFTDPHALLFSDPEHSEDEERVVLLGVTAASRLVVIVHCYRESDTVVRIISARPATDKERAFYEKGI
jgi:uncharacterized DUF497 family protein